MPTIAEAPSTKAIGTPRYMKRSQATPMTMAMRETLSSVRRTERGMIAGNLIERRLEGSRFLERSQGHSFALERPVDLFLARLLHAELAARPERERRVREVEEIHRQRRADSHGNPGPRNAHVDFGAGRRLVRDDGEIVDALHEEGRQEEDDENVHALPDEPA